MIKGIICLALILTVIILPLMLGLERKPISLTYIAVYNISTGPPLPPITYNESTVKLYFNDTEVDILFKQND